MLCQLFTATQHATNCGNKIGGCIRPASSVQLLYRVQENQKLIERVFSDIPQRMTSFH